MLNNRNIKTIKSNKLFDYKNLRSFKIIKTYDNLIYYLKLLTSIKRLYLVFYSWLFYLNNNNPLSKQRIISLLFINIDEKSEIWKIEKILEFKIDEKIKNSIINKKKCLIYKIKYIKSKVYNNLLWQSFINAIESANLIADYHHKYSNKFKLYFSFEKSFEWNSLLTLLIYNFFIYNDIEFELKYWIITTKNVTLYTLKYATRI